MPRCHHYDAFRCRSCTLLGTPRGRQLSDKEAHARTLVDSPVWLPTVAGADTRFRNKAKMAVGGSVDAPTLGILDRDLAGVDLHDCGLHSDGLRAALDRIVRLDPRRRPGAVRRRDAGAASSSTCCSPSRPTAS